jgi:hypothetical protein
MEQSNICAEEVPVEKAKENVTEKYTYRNKKKIFLGFMSFDKFQNQKCSEIPNRKDKEKYIPRYIIVKLIKSKYKEKHLKVPTENVFRGTMT